jgi:ribosome biogenesis GTPase A
MTPSIIDKTIVDLKLSFSSTVIGLQELATQLKLANEATTLKEMLAKINQPFQFVIVGEVKSGKSSFINALLGADICKVAPTICTDCVQEIVYGEQENTELLDKHLMRITRPIELLKTVAIVDTQEPTASLKIIS